MDKKTFNNVVHSMNEVIEEMKDKSKRKIPMKSYGSKLKNWWMYSSLRDWVWNIYYVPKKFINNVIMVCEWIPKLWNNWDWDFQFLFKIMQYKLVRMEKHIREEGHHTRKNQDAKEIQIAVNLLDRINNRDYLDNALIQNEREWGKCRFDFTNKFEKIWIKNLTSKQKYYADKDTLRCYKHEQAMEKQDKEYLFKYILKHHRKWWD